jgi:hypothetical protein
MTRNWFPEWHRCLMWCFLSCLQWRIMMLKTSDLVHVVTFLTWIWEVPSSNLSWDTNYYDTVFVVLFNPIRQVTTASFHILSCSLFTIIQSWHYIVLVSHKLQINHTVSERNYEINEHEQVQRVICISPQSYCLCRSKSYTNRMKDTAKEMKLIIWNSYTGACLYWQKSTLILTTTGSIMMHILIKFKI